MKFISAQKYDKRTKRFFNVVAVFVPLDFLICPKLVLSYILTC